MLLLLDLSEEIYRLIWGPEKVTVNKTERDKLFYKAAGNIFEKLLIIPDKRLHLIEYIKIFNRYGETFQYTPEMINKIFISIQSKTNKGQVISSVIENVKVINLNEKGEAVTSSTNEASRYNEFHLIFFDTLLTDYLIIMLYKNVMTGGYHILGFRSKDNWQVINYSERYIKIAFFLFFKFYITLDSYGEVKTIFNMLYVESHTHSLIKSIKAGKARIPICLFKNWETAELQNFIGQVNREVGDFQTYKCTTGEYTLPSGGKRLLILNLGNLSSQLQRTLLEELEKNWNKFERIIITTNQKPDMGGLIHFTFWNDLSDKSSRNTIEGVEKLFKNVIDLFERQKLEYKYLIQNTVDNEEERKKILDKLDEYYIGDYSFKTYKVNFWYDLPMVDDEDTKKYKDSARNISKKYFSLKAKKKYEITLDKNYWIITINENEEIKISYYKSKAMKYLVFLVKHYSEGRSIQYDKLEDVVAKWFKKGKVKKGKVIYGNISDRLSKLYDSKPELEEIQEYLITNSLSSGCYYQVNDKIEIELGDFYIPGAV